MILLRLLTFIIVIFFGTFLAAQNTIQPASELFKIDEEQDLSALDEFIHQYELFTIDAASLFSEVERRGSTSDIALNVLPGQRSATFTMREVDIRTDDYHVIISDDTGVHEVPATNNKSFIGTLSNDATKEVRLTLDEDYIGGVIETENGEYFIEPLRFFVPGASRDVYVVYNGNDISALPEGFCGTEDPDNHTRKPDPKPHVPLGARSGECYEIEMAIASDYGMYQKFGSVADVENHVLTVLNLVNGVYGYGNFTNDYKFIALTAQFIVTTSGGDPWTSSTDPSALLGDFVSWAVTGFGYSYDINTCWTTRDFDGATIGLARLSSVCGSAPGSVLENFSSSLPYLRALQAHEIGHNCSASHDATGSPTIMAPAVSSSSTWSANSVTEISTFLQSRVDIGCLANCNMPGVPPKSEFHIDYGNIGCLNEPVTFNNTSYNYPTSYEWKFPGAIPDTSTAEYPTVVYNSRGMYDVTLITTNSFGTDTVVKSNFITIKDKPVSNFTITNNGGGSFTFMNTSIDDDFHVWNFGNGDESFEDNPTYTYPAQGSYAVVLFTVGHCGGDTLIQNANYFDPVIGEFEGNITEICEGWSVNYDISATTGIFTRLEWIFEGGTPGTLTNTQNPRVTYNTAGTYDVTAIFSNGSIQDTVYKPNYITVSPPPVANFSYTVSGLDVTFTNTSTDYSSAQWKFGDGMTSTDDSPTHTYASAGTYNVELRVTSLCGNATYSFNVVLGVAPQASAEASDQNICVGELTQFTDISTGSPSNWLWTFEGGTPATSTDQDVFVSYDLPGDYDVKLVVTNSYGEDSVLFMDYIHVEPLAVSGFTFTTSGLAANFTSSATNYNTISWDFGDGNTSAAINPTHTYMSLGNYVVMQIVTNDCGSDTTFQQITISVLPSAGFSASDIEICPTNTIQFADQSGGQPISWLWSFPGGIPNTSMSPNPLIQYPSSGDYDVQLIVANALGADTINLVNYISVGEAPFSDFTFTTSSLMVDFTSLGTGLISWDFGDGNTSTDTNPTHTYATAGTYVVTLTRANDCGSETVTKTIEVVLSPSALFSASDTYICEGSQVQFVDNSGGSPTNLLWTFEGGSPATSTSSSPIISYATSGTYTVTLVASNAAGDDTIVMDDYITVEQTMPVADFNITSTNGLSITIEDASVSLGGTVSYNFGDGNGSMMSDPTHTYSNPGTYTVTQYLETACGRITIVRDVTVAIAPSALFQASQQAGCAPTTISFEDLSSGGATSISWIFEGGDPASSAASNPTVNYTTAGTYDVRLIASNSAGTDTLLIEDYITIDAMPTADFTFSASGNTVTFVNTSTNGNTVVWDFGDGNGSTLSNVTHTYSNTGSYTVLLIVTNPCGSNVITKTVGIGAPQAAFVPSVISGCAPLEVTFENNTTGGALEYNWSFEGGLPATSQDDNPTVVFQQSGNYEVILEASNDRGMTSHSVTIEVLPLPTALFSVDINQLTVTVTNQSKDATSYIWDFGDGTTSTSANDTHTYSSSGTYTIVLRAVNACGEKVTSIGFVLGGSQVQAEFSLGNVTTICVGEPITLVNQSTGAVTAYNWTFDGGTPMQSTEQSPTVLFNTPGDHTISLTVSNGSAMHTVTKTYTVLALPVSQFSSTNNGGEVSFNFTGGSQADYVFWDFGDGYTGSGMSVTHSYSKSGAYQVICTAVNNCGTALSDEVVQVVLSDLADISLQAYFKVYPNPFEQELMIEFDNVPTGSYQVNITNMFGQVMHHTTFDWTGSGQYQITEAATWPAGQYIIQVNSKEGTAHWPLVKLR